MPPLLLLLLRGFDSSLRFGVRVVCMSEVLGICHRPFSGRQFVDGIIPATGDVGWNIADVLLEMKGGGVILGVTAMLLL